MISFAKSMNFLDLEIIPIYGTPCTIIVQGVLSNFGAILKIHCQDAEHYAKPVGNPAPIQCV